VYIVITCNGCGYSDSIRGDNTYSDNTLCDTTYTDSMCCVSAYSGRTYSNSQKMNTFCGSICDITYGDSSYSDTIYTDSIYSDSS